MKNYNEFCKEQAKKLFAIIEQHQGLLQWQKTWKIQGNSGLPKGVGGFYRGINLWSLLTAQIDTGFGSSIWLTYNQIKQQGGHVQKGATGYKVCFFKMIDGEREEVGQLEDVKQVRIFRAYTVFNLDQTNISKNASKEIASEPVSFQRLLNVLGVHISEFGNQPHFQPSADVIVMPHSERFASMADYQMTLLHELIHWTGHQSRLDRQTIKEYGKSDVARAEEELIAEIGSLFLASFFGVEGNLLNHASYISGWKQLLDERAIGRALSQASKAFCWLVGHVAIENETAL